MKVTTYDVSVAFGVAQDADAEAVLSPEDVRARLHMVIAAAVQSWRAGLGNRTLLISAIEVKATEQVVVAPEPVVQAAPAATDTTADPAPDRVM